MMNQHFEIFTACVVFFGLPSAAPIPAQELPELPLMLCATPGDHLVTLIWRAPTAGAAPSAYNVYRSGCPTGDLVQLAQVLAPETRFVDTGAANNTLYCYVVRSLHDGRESGPSNEGFAQPPGRLFDRATDFSKSIHILEWLFFNGGIVYLQDAMDINDDGRVDVSDPIYAQNYLFRSGPAPPAPFGTEGPDPTPDSLFDCQWYSSPAPARMDLGLGFDGCPAEVTGVGGEVKTFEIFLTLTSSAEAPLEGAQGWSLSVVAEGGVIKDIALDGVMVSTIFDEDGDPKTPPTDPSPLELSNAGSRIAHIATGHWQSPIPEARGAVSAVIVDLTKFRVIQPKGVQRIAKLTLAVTIPEGDRVPFTLRFKDGLSHFGVVPVENIVTINGASFRPDLGSCSIALRMVHHHRFQSGNCNGDLDLDISDAVFLLQYLFSGAEAPPCLAACNPNQSPEPDISSAIFILNFLFIGGDPPRAPFPACDSSPDSDCALETCSGVGV